MIQALAGLAVLCLAALPLLAAPSWLVVLPAAAGAGLAVSGILTFSTALVTGSALVFLVELAVALWLSAPQNAFALAVAFGLALGLLLQSVELARRLRGAAFDAAVPLVEVRHWIQTGIAAIVACMAAIGIATAITGLLPFVAYPFVAAAGALGTLLALARSAAGAPPTGRASEPQ